MGAKVAYREDFHAWTRDRAARLRRLAGQRSPDAFPAMSPWTPQQILNPEFLPADDP